MLLALTRAADFAELSLTRLRSSPEGAVFLWPSNPDQVKS